MNPIRTLGLATLALALGVAFAAPAEARDNHLRGHDRGHSSQDWRRGDDRREHRRDDRRRDYRQARRHDDRRHDGWHDRRHDRRDVRVVYAPPPRVVVRHRGPPPWARGHHYRHAGYAPTYVVHDYGPYGLRQPPRGHHWRRSDTGDFLLVAIATGIIADVIMGR
ncbi:RcnB family protein [Luteimonas sp. MC1895]|uniref:RcnB family protein n=1 Tax=Luteimonas sp. MC1895 TaxID=2819513 RepID=UPI0018F0FC2D|nr:RcnB family protein [Luteimonas sp. MC1895]MBJ6980267.1 RcnB family protein [Luteimonas sp. MC1895]